MADSINEARPFVQGSELDGGVPTSRKPDDWDSLSNSAKVRDLQTHNKGIPVSEYDQGDWKALKPFRNFDGVGYDFPDPSLIPADSIQALMAENKDRPLQHQISVDNISQLQGMQSTATVSARYLDSQKNALLAEASRIRVEGGLAFDNTTTDSRTILSNGSYTVEDSPVRPMDRAAGGNGAEPIPPLQPSDPREPAPYSQSNAGTSDSDNFDITEPVDSHVATPTAEDTFTARSTLTGETAAELFPAVPTLTRQQRRELRSKERDNRRNQRQKARDERKLANVESKLGKSQARFNKQRNKAAKKVDNILDGETENGIVRQGSAFLGGAAGIVRGLRDEGVGTAAAIGLGGTAALGLGIIAFTPVGLSAAALWALAQTAAVIGGITGVGRAAAKWDDIEFKRDNDAEEARDSAQDDYDKVIDGRINTAEQGLTKERTKRDALMQERNNLLQRLGRPVPGERQAPPSTDRQPPANVSEASTSETTTDAREPANNTIAPPDQQSQQTAQQEQIQTLLAENARLEASTRQHQTITDKARNTVQALIDIAVSGIENVRTGSHALNPAEDNNIASFLGNNAQINIAHRDDGSHVAYISSAKDNNALQQYAAENGVKFAKELQSAAGFSPNDNKQFLLNRTEKINDGTYGDRELQAKATTLTGFQLEFTINKDSRSDADLSAAYSTFTQNFSMEEAQQAVEQGFMSEKRLQNLQSAHDTIRGEGGKVAGDVTVDMSSFGNDDKDYGAGAPSIPVTPPGTSPSIPLIPVGAER